ncbi:nucleoporin Nup186/Nup192/Nup205 [Pyronema omphalodes]|nr:nucleoporin Nup186/Nup192/Nup205 [Pyronema omphalodes]
MATPPSANFEIDNDLQSLSDTLAALPVPQEVNNAGLRQLLTDRLDNLKELLYNPPKNDESRKKLNEGKLEMGGVMWDVNDVFKQEAIQLADDYNIDEILAATFLLYGEQESQKLDRTAIRSAKFLYHTRRKNILDSIRLVFAYVVEEKIEGETRTLLENTVESLLSQGGVKGSTESFVNRCITSMNDIRQSVQQLRDKEKHQKTLGIAPEAGFKEDIDLEISFLRNQHDVLACIVYYIVKYKRAGVAELRRLLDVLKSVDRYDVFMAHFILPVFALISALCGPDSSMGFEQTIQLHREMLKNFKEVPWALRQVQAAILTWWLCEFNGLCNDPPSAPAPSKGSLDFYRDIQDPAKLALKDGGLELIMGLASDISSEPRLNSAKEDLHRFLQTRVPPLEDAPLLLVDFQVLLMNQFELFIDSFISNMATLLQIIKTAEEEDDIMNQRTYHYELERFFLIIHYVYDRRKDAGMAFWSDPESNLYGFLQWAARNQTPFMAATFCYMLASLSYGDECAEAAHKFLLDESMPGAQRNRRGEALTWNYIFKHVRGYIAELEKRLKSVVQSGPNYRPPQVIEGVEPAPELSMELDAALRLTSQIVIDCPEARAWLDSHPDFNFVSALFELLNLQATTQLWDSIFSTITAFLTSKDEAYGNKVWTALDHWALGGPLAIQSSAVQLAGSTSTPYTRIGTINFDSIITTVHPAEAFTRLLTKLVEPPEAVAELKDSLPFPETLGSSNRQPGILEYVDFVLGTIFVNTTVKNLPRDLPLATDREETVAEKLSRVHYKRFRPALQLSCLEFIHACLTTFNDNLLDMAHKGLSVDGGMRSSSLLTYTRLHPFGRVMEHILTEKCLNVLFEILQLGVDDLLNNNTEPSSAVVDGVLYTLLILDLTMQMQPTYFRVVRPFIKQQDSGRRKNVVGNSFERLEKAIHYHLETIVHVGLYIGSHHEPITLASLKLLEKFNISPEFTSPIENRYGQASPMNRALGAVEYSEESRRIVFNFINQWDCQDEHFVDVDGHFPLKLPFLKFLDTILAATPDQYTIAHMVLGFGYHQREGIQLSVAAGGIGSGVSLFHSILNAALDSKDYAIDDDANYVPAYCELKNACFSVLSRLWSSKVTSNDVLFILRANKFFFDSFMAENTIVASTKWGNVPISKDSNFFEFGASSFCDFLQRRKALFEYTALEVRQLNSQGASTMVQKMLSTLLGVTQIPERGPVANVHILDLLDFLEFVFPPRTRQPRVEYLGDASLLVFQEEDSTGVSLFDLEKVNEFLQIKKNSLMKSGAPGPELEAAIDAEISSICRHLFCENQLRRVRDARLQCLSAWANLVIIMLEDCEIEKMSKTAFILQALQAILPKLETFSGDDISAAEVLSSLAHALISHLPFESTAFGTGRGSDLANDRLYQLFRISLRCVQSTAATTKLREDFYNVALRYLNGMAALYPNREDRRHNIQTIKASGDKLLEVLCNDAYAGDGTCKIVSLLLLQALTVIAIEENSSYVIEALVRQNFLVVLVDSIKSIARDIANTPPHDIPTLLSSFSAATGFLFRVSQTRSGASHIINAGLFPALRECELFQVDPDMGLSADGNVKQYYELLFDVMRVVLACILSRGAQNRLSIEMGRRFLEDNKGLLVTVLKRSAGIGGGMEKERKDAKELRRLADVCVLLCGLTGFAGEQ